MPIERRGEGRRLFLSLTPSSSPQRCPVRREEEKRGLFSPFFFFSADGLKGGLVDRKRRKRRRVIGNFFFPLLSSSSHSSRKRREHQRIFFFSISQGLSVPLGRASLSPFLLPRQAGNAVSGKNQTFTARGPERNGERRGDGGRVAKDLLLWGVSFLVFFFLPGVFCFSLLTLRSSMQQKRPPSFFLFFSLSFPSFSTHKHIHSRKRKGPSLLLPPPSPFPSPLISRGRRQSTNKGALTVSTFSFFQNSRTREGGGLAHTSSRIVLQTQSVKGSIRSSLTFSLFL